MTALFRMLFSPSPTTYAAHALYVACSKSARNPFLFTDAHIADTLDGRFDTIMVHLFLTLERVKREPDCAAFQQALLECFFSDLDRALREMGVADLGVGRRIRKMGDACKGRLARYQSSVGDNAAWRSALIDNLYRGDETRAHNGLDAAIKTLDAFRRALDNTTYHELCAGNIDASLTP